MRAMAKSPARLVLLVLALACAEPRAGLVPESRVGGAGGAAGGAAAGGVSGVGGVGGVGGASGVGAGGVGPALDAAVAPSGGTGGAAPPPVDGAAAPDLPVTMGDPRKPGGAACTSAGDCLSALCTDGRCCVGVCRTCEACLGPGGTCVGVSSGPHDTCQPPNACAGAGICKPTGAPPGAACGAGADCLSGNCVDGHCCTQAACADCQRCTGEGGTCAWDVLLETKKLPNGLSLLFGFNHITNAAIGLGQSFTVSAPAKLRRLALDVSSFYDAQNKLYKGNMTMASALRNASGTVITTAETSRPGDEYGMLTFELPADLAANTTYIVTSYVVNGSSARVATTVNVAYGEGEGVDYPSGRGYTAAAGGGEENLLASWGRWQPNMYRSDLVMKLEGCKP